MPKEIIDKLKYYFAIVTVGDKFIRYMIIFDNIKVSSVGFFLALSIQLIELNWNV